MTTLQITSATPSQSGKSFVVKATSGDFFAKIDSKINTAVGKTINCETETSEYKGKTMNWIKTWAIAPVQNDPVPIPKTSNAGDIMRFMPFVSNTVASAIKAGYCQEPGAISAWAKGAYEAALALEAIAEFRQEME